MKNFFKKLSFVLAIAMVLTSIAPATASAAEVVPAKKVNVKNLDGEKITSVELDVEETETVKLGLVVKKAYKGQKSTFKTWAVSADEDVVEVTKIGNKKYDLTGVAAGETTITIRAAKTLKLAQAGKGVKAELNVVVNEKAAELSVEATGASELTATLSAEIAADSTVVVKRGTTTVNASAVIDGTKVVVTTDAKMIAGTYTVIIGELEASCDVEEQKVAEIVIKNENEPVQVCSNGVTTDTAIKVYYDVLDQYGDSLRKSSTISWTSSLNQKVDESASEGWVIFGKANTDTTALVYGSSVYITAVYSKGTNVCTKSAEVKVGLPSKPDTVEFAGIVKKGTNVFTTLPSSFATDRYLLVFKVNDQYGNPMDMSNFDMSTLSFTSSAPLTLSVSKRNDADTEDAPVVTIAGETYGSVYVQPELYVNKGGSSVINGISSATGTVSAHTLEIGADQIVTSFKLDAPADIVSEGRTVELPFTALDQNGEEITSYRVLNGNVSISPSAGRVVIKEKDNGTAVVEYTAPATGATDDIDLYITITTVVQNSGGFDSLNFYVREKARPAAISSVGGATALLEGNSVTIYTRRDGNATWKPYFVYVDQYGRVMDESDSTVSGEVGAWYAGDGKGVLVDYTGTDRITVTGAASTMVSATSFATTGAITVKAATNASVDTAVETLKFALYEYDSDLNANKEIGGSAKKVSYTVYDISKLINFELSGVADYVYAGDDTSSMDDHQVKVGVNGYTADGTKVSVPLVYDGTQNYYTVSVASILGYAVKPADVTINGKVVTFDGDYETYADGTAAFKDGNTVAKVYKDEKITLNVIINDVNNGGQKDIVSKTLVLGGYAPSATTFTTGWGAYSGYVVNATNGAINTLIAGSAEYGTAQGLFNYYNKMFDTVEDQYGVEVVDPTVKMTITKIVENENGQNATVFTVTGNGTATPVVSGAEIGDTFTITYSIDGTSAVYSLDVTVGADQTSSFNGNTPSPRY